MSVRIRKKIKPQKRTHTVSVCLSRNEMKMLKKQAEGVSLSDYIRILIHREEEKVWGGKKGWEKVI